MNEVGVVLETLFALQYTVINLICPKVMKVQLFQLLNIINKSLDLR